MGSGLFGLFPVIPDNFGGGVMKRIRFDCHGHNAPAYGCNEPGDNSGWYYRADDGDKEPTMDINEMRRRIHDVAYLGLRADGKDGRGFSSTSATVHQVYQIADRDGLSGEDRMTMLAYHLMAQYESLFDKVLDIEHNRAPEYVVIPDKEAKP